MSKIYFAMLSGAKYLVVWRINVVLFATRFFETPLRMVKNKACKTVYCGTS
jgi:hypothetical protein